MFFRSLTFGAVKRGAVQFRQSRFCRVLGRYVGLASIARSLHSVAEVSTYYFVPSTPRCAGKNKMAFNEAHLLLAYVRQHDYQERPQRGTLRAALLAGLLSDCAVKPLDLSMGI